MELNPLKWLSRETGKAPAGNSGKSRLVDELGPYRNLFDSFVPRVVDPHFYEAVRESVSIIDAAINWLCTLDGIVRVEGENEALVREIREWMQTVRVNDKLTGFQAYYQLGSNEKYEQGFYISDWELNRTRSDVARLFVADSKGVVFHRNATTGELETWYRPPGADPQRKRNDNTERLLRNEYRDGMVELMEEWSYRRVDSPRLVYDAFNPEASNPYGTSLIRSLEFLSKVLLTINNSVKRTWVRFGDPTYHLQYGTNARISAEELEDRRLKMAAWLKYSLTIRENGNSADFVTATGKDDTVTVKVVGSDNQVLEVEKPARHVIEQIVSKTKLAAWLLGFHFSTAERLALKQCELMLQDSKTRFESRKPSLNAPIEAMLRARGRTWKDGDWYLVQELPNVGDIVAKAQANFLNAQAEQVSSGGGDTTGGAKVAANGKVLLPFDDGYPAPDKMPGHRHKESFVEDDPALPRLERDTERSLVTAWQQLRRDTLKALSLPAPRKDDGQPVFVFDASQMQDLLDLLDRYIDDNGGPDSVLVSNVVAAWERGLANAQAELDVAAVADELRREFRATAEQAQLANVRNAAVRVYRDEIAQALADGVYDGLTPQQVANQLRARFDLNEYNWRRLARTEISNAQFLGKLKQYAEAGIEHYDWLTAPDACTICVGLASAGPYIVGLGPTPANDSHPECRCTINAHV